MPDIYRSAARIKEGDFIARADGSFQKITKLVQILSPVSMALVTLADGLEASILHINEANYRTAKEQEKAGGSDGR